MTAERVIPRGPKGRDDGSVVFQQPPHDAQYLGWVVEVFKRIQRQDHVGLFVGGGGEKATIRNALGSGPTPRILERAGTIVDAANSLRAARRYLNGVFAIATTKVDHDLVFGVCPDAFAEKR